MPPDLATLQDWMQDAILAASAPDARAHVHGDNRLTAEDRVAIYASGYRQRLIECLESEYPLLSALAGPTAFALFAQGYIAAHPSRSYTLYEFGAGFADWLEASRPPGGAQDVGAIPAALARIERTKAEVHRARGIERAAHPLPGLEPAIADILALATPRRWWRPDSVRLLALPFDFSEMLATGEPVPPRSEAMLLAVARAHYRVACYPLEPWQFDWLSTLPGDPAQAVAGEARLAGWLPFAAAHGLVAGA
ncbi:putative DNA-binding domain-containing protein [Sphingomonas sp. R-74633]|uniref:HvfC/BufC N-terminal domain-containing protein n=1 Tax=Sphingomonas sp. R-74633 TaxID=2751188 RepID=UPI0015D26F66|nr:DNA-binding domain-containing protein [Sphingomonas sp. R-74633]NYT41247.1 putative DNA-binding domain-containing protein [Sphingomonas sp. R-74633]